MHSILFRKKSLKAKVNAQRTFKTTLALFFFKTMFEKHNDRSLLTVHLLVFHQDDHSFRIHVFSSEKLEVAKFSQQSFHDSVDILLESLDLVLLVVALQIGHDPLHVVLEVVHVISLLPEPSLDQSVVEDEVHSRLHGLLSALISLLGAGIGALENKV